MKKFWISILSLSCIDTTLFYFNSNEASSSEASTKKKTISTIYAGTSSIGAPESAQGRNEWQLHRLRDPRTGLMPAGIRSSELQYAQKVLRKNARRDKSLNWIDRGPIKVGGRTREMALDVRDENTRWDGAVSGGIWR